MTEREMKKDKAEEKVQQRKKSPDLALEKVKAQDEAPEANAMETVSLEAHNALLSDARLSHPANVEQKARIVSGLQRSYGNTYVQRLLSHRAIQPKLTVNPPDDAYEKEADQVAEAIAKTPTAQREAAPEEEEVQTKLQREAAPEEEEVQTKLQREAAPEEEEEPLQGKTADNQVPEVSQGLEERINEARGSGEALPDSIRASFEPHFARDFSDVRIHNDSEADDLSQNLGARAFTTGKDIFFRSGDYQPQSEEGQKLLGHEMTHVVQQNAVPMLQRQPVPATKAPAKALKALWNAKVIDSIKAASERWIASEPKSMGQKAEDVRSLLASISTTIRIIMPSYKDDEKTYAKMELTQERLLTTCAELLAYSGVKVDKDVIGHFLGPTSDFSKDIHDIGERL